MVYYITNNLKNPEGAWKLIVSFENKLNSVLSFPHAYPVIFDSKLEIDGLRKCPLGNYLIIYHINEGLEQVEVVRVVYQREDFL